MRSTILFPIVLVLAACGGAPPPPQAPPYQASFQYKVPEGGSKIDVTVGLVAPQFSGDGAGYWQSNKEDDVTQAMVRGLRTSFEELFTAKGFNIAGPFESLDAMTFPEKKGSEFVLYPDIDVDAVFKIGEIVAAQDGNALTGYETVYDCDWTFRFSGAIVLTAREPLSGEKMWLKRVDISRPAQVIHVKGDQKACTGASVPRPVADLWAKTHEEAYLAVMQGLDRYVNAEEFVVLKKQAGDLRTRKVY